jgi:hypothetical protein
MDQIVSAEKNKQARLQRYEPCNVNEPVEVNFRSIQGRPTRLSILDSIERVGNTIALRQIKTYLRENYDINLSLLKLRITLKSSSKLLDRVNSEATLNMEYASFFTNNSPTDKRNCIFIDESGFNLHLRRSKARSRRGTTVMVVIKL